jgi:hypothetical protein
MSLLRLPDKPIRISQDKLDEMDNGLYIGTFKRDGWRAVLCHTEESEYQVWSRHNKRLDTLPDFDPAIIDAFKELDTPAGTQIDGEWERRRAGNKEGANRVAIFGVLRWDKKWLGRAPEEERWERTLALPLDGSYLFVPEHAEHGFRDLFERSKEDWANEGIVLKLKKSRLILDRRESKKNNGWYKIKWRDGADGQTLTDF